MIYKVFREDEYADFIVDGQSKGSADDLEDGFIHFSTYEQLSGTLAKHFADEDALYLIAVDDKGLEGLKWEKSRNDALFPHFYGILTQEMVREVFELRGHELPKGLN